MLDAIVWLSPNTMRAVRAINSPALSFYTRDDRLYLEAHGDVLLRAKLPAIIQNTGRRAIDILYERRMGAGTLFFGGNRMWREDHCLLTRHEDEGPDHFTYSSAVALPLKRVANLLRWATSTSSPALAGIHLAPFESRLAAYACNRRLAARIVLDAPSMPPVTLPAPLIRAIPLLRGEEALLSVDGDRIVVDGGDWQLATTVHDMPPYPPIAAQIDECAGDPEPATLDDVLRRVPGSDGFTSHVSRLLGKGPLTCRHSGDLARFDAADRTLLVTAGLAAGN